jgi:hypothetical protein
MTAPALEEAARRDAATLLQLHAWLASAVRGYCQAEAPIVDRLTSLEAVRAAVGTGDLQHLVRLSELRRQLVESPDAMALRNLERALVNHLGLSDLWAELSPLARRSAEAQEACAQLGRAVVAAGNSCTDADVQRWRGAYLASIQATLDLWDAAARVIPGAVRREIERSAAEGDGEWLTLAAVARGLGWDVSNGKGRGRRPDSQRVNRLGLDDNGEHGRARRIRKRSVLEYCHAEGLEWNEAAAARGV